MSDRESDIVRIKVNNVEFQWVMCVVGHKLPPRVCSGYTGGCGAKVGLYARGWGGGEVGISMS
jgi:hypothetical protein